ncbi:hypothetical protein [Aurantiacibacter aquimixticola]|uniref:Uncharacterized protein n=1 Tax=Aurantiacibacter aquimixticola TaxID=1958945 RepID=A0A419RW32_9SPHN|nr:hypothetical protein [Aurantiacibacter aquimixticola]RJY09989.1 hypothetical protein D6201_12075 [Aurantiacibacter aquimixticola]
MLAACAAERAGTTPSGAAATDLIRELQPCGVTAPRTPGDSEYAHLLDGPGPVRPCHLITADHVAFAREVQDGEVVYDPNDPNDEERALRVAPDISVSGLQCHDVSDDGSEVSCDFTATQMA